jgi:hypothetical protein
VSTELALLLLVAASLPTPLAVDQPVMLGGGIDLTEGSKLVGADRRLFSQVTPYVGLRGGLTDRDPLTDFGTQLGIEYGLRLGAAAEGSSGDPEIAARLLLSLRSCTFDWPLDGQLTFHLGPELAGGGRWWADKARFTLVGGVRAATLLSERARGVRAELQYELVPGWITGARDDLSIDALEHRVLFTFAVGSIGVGFAASYDVESARLSQGSVFKTHGHTLGGVLEWRSTP